MHSGVETFLFNLLLFQTGSEALSCGFLLLVCAKQFDCKALTCSVSFHRFKPLFVWLSSCFDVCSYCLLRVVYFFSSLLTPLKRFQCLLVVCDEKRFLIFVSVACKLLCPFIFPCLAFVSNLRIPDLRFASHLALCVRLSGRGCLGVQKRSGVRYKMFRGRGKDCSK